MSRYGMSALVCRPIVTLRHVSVTPTVTLRHVSVTLTVTLRHIAG